MKNFDSIRKTRDFKRVYDTGGRSSNRYIAVYALRNGTCGRRLGISVSRKVGNAVERNRIKRLIKESFRLSGERVAAGYDIVVAARTELGLCEKRAAFGTVRDSLERLLDKQSLISRGND